MEKGIDVVLEDEELEVDAQADFLKGEPGYTPKKGIDYYTEAEKQEIIQKVTSDVNKNILPQEQQRENNEQGRIRNENIRIESESQRETQENTRQSKELTRESNEELRKSNETIRENKEAVRTENENTRIVKENERANAENKRVVAEEERAETFNQMEQDVEKAVQEIEDKKQEYNDNTIEKIVEYNNNAEEKTNTFNDNVTTKTTEYNTNATNKTNTFNTNATIKITEYNTNATEKIDEYNQNADAKIEEYNANAKEITDRVELLEEKNDRHYDYIEDLQLRTTELEIQAAILEKENAELKETVNSMQIPGEAEGNSIHLADSSDLGCEIVPIGNAEQEKREGYNLCNAPYTVDNKLTCTATRDDYYKVTDYYATLEAGKEYRISFESDGEFGLNPGVDTVQMFLLKDKAYDTKFDLTGKNVLFTPSVSGDYYVRVDVNMNGKTHSFWNFFIRKSTETREFELFGASPSPDYPSKIVTVGQNVQLFDKDNTNTIKAIINGTTKEITAFDTCRSIYIPCDKNEDYAVSRVVGTRFVVGTTTNVPTAGSVCNQIVANNTASSITIKTGENDNYLAVFYYNSGTDTLTEQEIIDSIKISKGTSTGGYSTYGQGSVEIDVVNKNEFNVRKNNYTNFGLTVELNNSSIKINGTCSGGGNILREDGNNGIYLGNFKAGKYYVTRYPFSGFTKVGSGFAMYFRKNSPSEASLFNFGTDNIIQQRTITLTEDTDLYISMWANANDIYDNVEFLFSIYKDDSTKYVPHESQKVSLPIQKEFVKLGDYEDTFIKQDGKWYEAHYSPKFVFDGTENLTANGQVNRYYRYDFSLNGMQKGYKKAILSHFKETDETSFTSITEICIATHPSHPTIVFITDFSTVDEFKTWISEQYANGKLMEGYYVLSTPKLIECTPEQEQILNSFHTYKNITNISVDGIGTVKVIYKKDLETINKNNEARITALEAALVS